MIWQANEDFIALWKEIIFINSQRTLKKLKNARGSKSGANIKGKSLIMRRGQLTVVMVQEGGEKIQQNTAIVIVHLIITDSLY